jgi:hypothetical protein
MSRPEKTEISNDGLRYKSKKGGSPFEGLGRTGDTMSLHQVRRTRTPQQRFFQAHIGFIHVCLL